MSQSRGVAILFNNTFDLTVKNIRRDKQQNYTIFIIKTVDKNTVLVNIYCPNKKIFSSTQHFKKRSVNYKIQTLLLEDTGILFLTQLLITVTILTQQCESTRKSY